MHGAASASQRTLVWPSSPAQLLAPSTSWPPTITPAPIPVPTYTPSTSRHPRAAPATASPPPPWDRVAFFVPAEPIARAEPAGEQLAERHITPAQVRRARDRAPAI